MCEGSVLGVGTGVTVSSVKQATSEPGIRNKGAYFIKLGIGHILHRKENYIDAVQRARVAIRLPFALGLTFIGSSC